MARVLCEFPEPSKLDAAYVAAQHEAVISGLTELGYNPADIVPTFLLTPAPHPPYYRTFAELGAWQNASNNGWRAGRELLERILAGADTLARKAA